jgi:hypothetical protein
LTDTDQQNALKCLNKILEINSEFEPALKAKKELLEGKKE